MAAVKLRSQVSSAFKMHGLMLRAEATRYLVEVLGPIRDRQREEAIDRLIEAIQKLPLPTSTIDKNICEQAVVELNAEEEEDSDKILNVIDAFSVPRFSYQTERKKFLPASSVGEVCTALHGDATTKSVLHRNRYKVLHQRTTRHELFSPAVIGGQTSGQKFQLHPVEYLLGSNTKVGDIIVLGMLTQLKEGKWYLEDNTGAVPLDLSSANFHSGLFTESCFVLAEGSYDKGVFNVTAFGFPPPETSKTTLSYFGNINFFGGPSSTNPKASAKLRQTERDNEDAMFVFLSDVWLDDLKVREKLSALFMGYADAPPTAFIFCGNFTSKTYGKNHQRLLRESLEQLWQILKETPELIKSCRFIFVPGPEDPGNGHILPRPPIPTALTRDFLAKVPSAVFATNPCRIQYCTQEIVVFREDIVMKMCRNCVRFPSEGDITNHFTKTLLCQGHLCPLPLHVEPIYWAYDHALSLYPSPDLVVCADKYDPYSNTQGETTFINPGSFPRSDFSFKVYMPSSKQVEDSRIPDN